MVGQIHIRVYFNYRNYEILLFFYFYFCYSIFTNDNIQAIEKFCWIQKIIYNYFMQAQNILYMRESYQNQLTYIYIQFKIIKTQKIMENNGKGSSIEQPSEQSNSSQSKQNSKDKQLAIYDLDWFPITTSPWIASISFVFNIIFVIHSVDFYADNAGSCFNNERSFKILSQFIIPGIQSIALTFNTLLSILSILTFVFNKCVQSEGYKYLLGWVGNKLFPILRYLIDLNVAIAATFTIKSPIIAIFLGISSVINLLINFLGQNYTLRKDYLCCKSMKFMILWKSAVIIGYSINCTGYYLIQKNSTTLVFFLIVLFILFLSLFICYFLFGYLIYRHTSSQIFLLFIINLFLSITTANLYDTASTLFYGQFVQNRNLFLAGTFFMLFSLLSYSLWTKIKKQGSSPENKDPIKRIYFLFNKLQNSSENINDDCEIRGLIRHHLSHQCNNEKCFINSGNQSHYDSKKNKYCFSNKLNQGKTSFVKFIAKCIYEQELENLKWNSVQLLLDYIQFYFLKLKNLFKVSILLVELQKKFLTPFQKIRLNRLRRVMREQNQKLNEQLYNGSLDFQSLILSQSKFDQIQSQLKQVLQKNIQFWKYIENDSISLSVIVKMLKPNFQLIQRINNNWKNIAHYFQIQKVWKFIYVCYILYFRNQKLKPQLIEQFGQSVHEDDLFTMENMHIDKTTQTAKMYISKMIFQQDVCCIHINHNQQKPIIKSVSRYFERMFGYQKNQILQSSLDIMMTPCFRKFHKKKFLKWAGSGMSSKQNNYEIKKVFPVNKQGFVVPAFKFYKQFLCLNKQLQYIAMFKRNKQQQHVMILNQNYEIQGITQSLVQKLQITAKQYNLLIGLNILIFLPSLIQYTKFDDDKGSLSDDLLTVIMQGGQKTSLTYDLTQKSRSKRGISAKKQFTKNNLLLKIPNIFQKIRQVYLSSLSQQVKGNTLNAICRSYKALKQLQVRKKFKVQVQVRLINIQEKCSYLQFYLRQIESTEKNNENKSMQMKNIVQKNSIQSQQQPIHEQDISKFFQNSHNSQNISLSFTDNIFIKQDNNQPVNMISHVKSISVSARIIFVLFLGLLIGTIFFQCNNYDLYRTNAQKTVAMVNFQLKSLIINNKYHSQVLGKNLSKQSILSLTNSLRQIRQNIQFKKSLLDITINHEKNYTIRNGNTQLKLDQVDIIDKMFEIIIHLLYKHNGNAQNDIETYEKYKSLVLPYIDGLITNSLDNIKNMFNQVADALKIKANLYIALIVGLLILGFFLLISNLVKITKSFVSFTQIFTQFSEADLKKIIKYCLSLDQLFNHLSKKYDQFKDRERVSQKQIKYQLRNYSNQSSSFNFARTNLSDGIVHNENQEQDNANLNKKVKKVQNGKQLTNIKLKSIIYVILFQFFMFITSFGINMYTTLVNSQVKNYQQSGHDIFQYYSAINVYLLAMKDRAYKKQSFNPSEYKIYFQKIVQMRKLKYQQAYDLNSRYMQVRNSILFENVCRKYPQVLSGALYNIEDCQSIAENNLQHGVQTFLFYMIHNIDQYMNSASYEINPKLLEQLEIGTQITNLYLEYMLQSWSNYFLQILSALKINIIIICSAITIFRILVYIILIEFLIVGNLKQNFVFFRKVYNNMMPDFIITKEKIIKAKLEVEGFIKK